MATETSTAEFVAWGIKKMRPVLGFTIYLKGPLANLKAGVAHAHEGFLTRVERELNWYSDSKVDRVRKATPKLLRYPLTWLSEPNAADREFGWFMWAAEDQEDAPASLFEGYSVERTPHPYMSYLRVTFPLEFFGGDYAKLLPVIRDLVSDLPVFYGTGGYFFSESLRNGKRHMNSGAVYAAAMRFSGIEVDCPEVTSAWVPDAIKTINWLTLIHDELVARLGGLDALRVKLDPEVVIHRLAHGVMLQAGKEPGIGDVNAGERLPLYRSVAKVLKPIRTKTHPELGATMYRSFGEQGTADWLARFD